eukprot:Skav234680  [mRNA]  locus=scaffold3643:5346:7635:+ [translate_table: standard]
MEREHLSLAFAEPMASEAASKGCNSWHRRCTAFAKAGSTARVASHVAVVCWSSKLCSTASFCTRATPSRTVTKVWVLKASA